MDTTIVIFRWEREGGVFALFPELPADNHGFYATCYQHIGQHCAADYYGCIAKVARPSPASTVTYSTNLKAVATTLIIRHRATPVMHERRRFQQL